MAEQAQHADLERLWEEHIRHEFSTRSTDDTLETMVDDAYVDHVPVLTGGSGQAELRQFYSTHFIPKMPPDMEMTPVSRTIGTDQLVDEMVIKFTHSIEMDWMLPGISPTGRWGRSPIGGNRPVSGWQTGSRAYLLGSSLGARPTRIARSREVSGIRSRERPESSRPRCPREFPYQTWTRLKRQRAVVPCTEGPSARQGRARGPARLPGKEKSRLVA
jgi:hypothetical protein